MRYNIPTNFDNKNLDCPCGCGMTPAKRLLLALESLRDLIGQPLKINSGCRCPAHNKTVGGAAASMHTQGIAVDIAWINDPVMIRIIHNAGRFRFNGVGVNWGRFIHLDMRLEPGYWSY